MSKFLLLLTFLSCTTPSDNPFCPTGEVETFFVKRHEKRHALRSRMATHRVFSIDVNEMVGVGTGTVFDFEGTTVVLTAAHVVSAPGSRVSIEVGSRFYSCEVVYFDSLADLAVLVPESSANLHPLPWKTTPPRQMGIYDEVSYTGYPNNDAKLSVKGYISAVSENGNYYLHSYAGREPLVQAFMTKTENFLVCLLLLRWVLARWACLLPLRMSLSSSPFGSFKKSFCVLTSNRLTNEIHWATLLELGVSYERRRTTGENRRTQANH